MRKILVLVAAIVAVSCSKSKDFSKIKVGMKSSEVKELVGEPDEQTEFFAAKIWMYKDGNDTGYLISIVEDTVSGINGGEELKKSLQELNDGLEDLGDSLDELKK